MNDTKTFKNASNATIKPLTVTVGKPTEGPSGSIKNTSNKFTKYMPKAFNRPTDKGACTDGFEKAKGKDEVKGKLSPATNKFTQSTNNNANWEPTTKKESTENMKPSLFDQLAARVKSGQSALTIKENEDVDLNAPDANLDGAGFDETMGDMGTEDLDADLEDDIDDVDDDIDVLAELKVLKRTINLLIDKFAGEEGDDLDDLEDDLDAELDAEPIEPDVGDNFGGGLDNTPSLESVSYGQLKTAPKACSGKSAMGKHVAPGKLKSKRGKKANANIKGRDFTGKAGKPTNKFGPKMSDKVTSKRPKGKNSEFIQ